VFLWVLNEFGKGLFAELFINDGPEGGKVTVRKSNFFGHQIVDDL
jgi:hypothetical protein